MTSNPITDLAAALKQLYPEAQPGTDYRIKDFKGVQTLSLWALKDADGNAIPSPIDTDGNPGTALLAADSAATLAAAVNAKELSLSNGLKMALLAQFNSWTPAQRYALNGARLALNDDLTAGNMTDAIDGVTNFALPDPSLAPLQSAVLAALNTYAPKFTALEVATTVDAINAIN